MDEYPEEMRPKRPSQPGWLSLYLQCRKFTTLPYDGGLLDQPVELWQSIMAAGEAYEGWLQDRQNEQQMEIMNNAQLRRSMGLG